MPPDLPHPITGRPVRTYLRDFRRVLSPALHTRAASGSTTASPAGTVVYPRGGAGGGPAFPWRKLAFGYQLIHHSETDPPESRVRIYPGSIRMHAVAIYTLEADILNLDGAGAEVTLIGVGPWVYAQVTRGAADGTPPEILVSTSEPITTTTTLRIPLYRFKLQEGGTYALLEICNMGDINLDTPLL